LHGFFSRESFALLDVASSIAATAGTFSHNIKINQQNDRKKEIIQLFPDVIICFGVTFE
jgi:hypothetical protein